MFCPEITIIHKKEQVNEPNRNMRIFDGVRRAGRLSGAYMLSYYVRELAVRDETDRALAAWEQLLQTGPSAHRVQYALVFLTGMLLRQKAYEKCRQLIDTAVEQYGVPLSAFLCYHLGLAAEGLGDFKEADRQYRLATEIPVDISGGMIAFTGYDDYLPCLKLCALAYDRGETDESEAWNSRAGRAWPEGRAWRINRERFFTPPLPSGREPLVSVIMPAYNVEAYVSEAISSVLDQSWQNFELIIVDNASTDATCDEIRRFSDPRIRFLQNDRNIGVAGSTNRAIGVSRGEYLALMDADDVSLPDRLQAQLTAMENDPGIMVLGTASSVIDPEGKAVGCEGVPGLSDYRFYMEASKLGAISCLADIHHRYRVHGGGITATTRREMPAERARMYNRIRCDSLRMSGVRLNAQQESLLGRLLPENVLPVWNRHERDTLTALFAEIRQQLAAAAFPAMRELDDILWRILNH